uniref:Apolipophorin n=1 Tax=Timema tahoe TaxID=61484 RepID=A0A7R9IKD5_9NEOP|nr:unnamed protein product [Timema tahoe]
MLKNPARRFLVDALPLMGTAEGMTAMTDLFKSGEVSSSDMDSWITSLSFQTRITLDMLLEASSLLEVYPSGATTLSVSAMVHSFCSETTDCAELGAVRDIMTRLEGPLRDHCGSSGDPRTEKLLLLALKAVGNAGVLVGPPDSLRKCHESDNPVEVRLAAISAYRRLPCDESSRHHLLDTYTDRREDTEVRIAAYLAVMKCPSARILRRIKDTLYSEDVNQVASFVWTHLTNLQETSSPDKQTLKDMVANDFLKNKFKTDVRKFSRNYEASLFSEILNAGGTVDSNVIFSPESYLPRSASLNLTVDLFGEAFNVLEFGGRAEGLEQYVEDLFGPDGYYPDKSLRKTLRNIKDRFRSQQEEIENGIGALARSFDVKGKLDRAARASLYARVFGNELKYSQFEGLEDVTGGLAGLASPWEVLSRLLSGNTVDYSKSLVFVDASYVIPTSIGLPLEFTVNGSASIALKMGGKIDLEELWTRGSMDVQGHVMPSVAVEFSGLMSVDAFVSKAGVRSVSTLRSNTYLDGKVKVQNGKIADVKINVPRDKVDILDVTSKLFLVGGAPESQEIVELRGVVEDKERHKACTPQILSTLTGMQLCGELSYRNASRFPDSPYFPLTGPFILSVFADKTDVFDSYELNYRGVRELTKFKDQMTYQLNVDTPGSRVDRKLKLLFSLDNSNKAVKVNVMTPFFRLETDAKLEDDLNGKGFDVSVRLNDDEVLDARGAARASFNGNMGRYQPFFSLTVMNRKLVDLTGRVDFVTGSKYIGDFNLLGFTKDPVLISGDLNVDREKWEVSASFKADAINGSVHSSARFNDDFMSVKATAQYGLPGRKEQSVVFSAKTQRSLKGTLAQRSAYLNIQMSAFPQYGVELSLDEQRSSDYLERRAQLGLGEVQWQTGFQRRHKIAENHTELSTLFYVACPKRGVDYKLDLLYQITFKDKEKGLEFEMFWDKDSDPDKRVFFLARSDHDKRELSIEIPGDYARVEMSQLPDGVRGTLEWSGHKKVDSRFTWDSGPGSGGVLVELSTPFVGLKEQTLGARYNLSDQHLVVEGEISWQGKEARLEVHVTTDRASPSILHVTGSLTVNSSIPLIPSVSAHLDHHDNNTLTRVVTTSLQFEHADRRSRFLSEWTLGDATLEGNVSWEGVGQSLSTDLYFLSGHDNLDARLQVTWSEKERRTVSVEVKSESGSRFRKFFRVITPFEDFQDSHLELFNRNDESGVHMKMGVMCVLMTADMEVGVLEEAITVSADNKTLYSLDLHGEVESFPDNMDLHLSLKGEGKAVKGNILRHQDDTSSRTAVYGVWDEAMIRAEVVSRFQMEGASVFHNHEVILSSTFLKNDTRFSLSHSREPGRVWSEIIIPGQMNITHRFSAGTFLNWEHLVSLTSPRVNATAQNKMSYIPGEELMARSYIRSNELEILAEYNYTNSAEGRGAVATFLCPWSNPITANLALSLNGSTVLPILMVRYGEDRELRVQGEVMFTFLEGVLRLEVTSPFSRQLSLDLAYSLADASVLAGAQWGDARLETGAVYHVENRTYKLNAYLETPFKNWETLSLRGKIKLSEEIKIVMLNIDGNPGFLPLTLYGNLKMSSDQFEVATAFMSQFDALNDLTLHLHYMFPGILNRDFKLFILKDDMLAELLVHYKFDEETIFKFGEAGFSLKTPLRSVETLGARLWYNFTETNAGLNVHKNGHKIEADLNSDGDSTFFKFNSPFKILRNVSLSLRRTFVPERECTVTVVVNYNGQAIELGGYLSSPDENSVSASVEVRTPFEMFKLVRFDYSFKGLHDHKKTGTITISKNNKRFDVTGTFSSVNMSGVEFNLHIDTPLKGYENMITGASYNALLSDDDKDLETLGKANLYFELEGARKDIYIDFSLKNSSASAKVMTPFKGFENLSISVRFSFDNDTFLGNSKLNWNSHDIDVRVTVNSFNSDVHVGATTSVQGFENVTLHARYNLMEREKTASLNAQLNGNDLIDLSISGFFEYLEGRAAVSIQTYKKEFEAISLLASYDVTDDFSVKLVYEENGDRSELSARLTPSTDRHVLRVETPFRGYRDVVLTLKHDMGDKLTLGATLQKDDADTVVDSLLEMNRSGILMILKTPLKSYREIRVSFGFSLFGVEEPDYNISLTVSKNSVQVLQTSLTAVSSDTKLGVNFKHSFGANEFEVSAWCYPGFPPKTLNLVVTQNNEIVASLEGTVEDLRGDGFTTHLQLTVKQKIRRLTVQFYPRETLYKASVDWDTTSDSFVVEFNYENITHALNIIVETPFPDFKGFSLSCTYGKEHILAELKTSVVGYEHLSARGSYKLAGNSPKSISFSASKNMDVINLEVYSDLRPHHVDVSMTVQTPFDSLDRLSIDLTHRLEEGVKRFSVKVQIRSDVYMAGADLASAHRTGDMTLRLSTPLASIQKINILSNYDFSKPTKSNFMFVGEVNNIKHINVELEMDHLTSRGRGVVHFVRPFTGSTFATQVSYDFSDRVESYLLEGSLTIPSGALFNASASVSHDFTGGNLSTSATEQNTWQGVALSWEIENSIITKKLATSLTLGKNITYEAVLSLRKTRPTDVEAYFNVKIPYSQFYTGLVQVNLSDGKRKSGNIKLTWPHGQFVQFQGGFRLDPTDNHLALALSVDSSFTELNNLFKMEDSVVPLNVNRENVLTLNLQTVFTNSKSFVVFSLESPLTRSLFLHLGYDLTSEDGSAVIDLSQGSFHMKIKTIINLTSNNPVVDMEISIPTLHVPLFHFRSQMFMKDSQYGLALTLQTNEQSLWELTWYKLSSSSISGISIFIHTPINGFENFAVVAKLDSSEGISAGFQLQLFKYLELNASYSETYNIRFSVSGTIASYDPISLESIISAKGPRKSWEMKLDVLGEQLELGAGSNFLAEGSFSVQALFRSPWTQDIDVVGNYEANTGDEIDITIKHGDHVTTSKAKFTRSKTPTASNVGLRFSFNNFSASLDTEIDLGANVSLNVRAHLGQHSLRAKLEYTNIRVIARIYCDTPFESLREIDGHSEVYFNVGENSETHVALMLRLDDRLYQFFMAATYANSHAYGNFTVSSPSFKIENEVFDIKVGAHTIDLNFLANGENVKLKFGQILSWPLFSVNVSVDIPFIDRLKHVAFTSNLNLLKKSVSTSAETSSGKMFSLTLNLVPNDFLIKLDTPYEIIPSLELSNKYRIEPHLVSKSTGKVNWKKSITSYEISSEFQNGSYLSHILLNSGENRIFEFSASLIAPGTQWETIDAQFLLSCHSKTLSLQSHVDITVPATANVQLSITTPFQTLPELAVTAKLNKNNTQGLRGDITVIAFNQTMVIKAEATINNLETIEVKLVVYMPIYELNLLDVTAWFSQQHWKTADAHVRMNFLWFEGQVNASYELVDNRIDGKLVIESSLFRGNIPFSASLTGDTPRDMALMLSVDENKVFLSYALQNLTTFVGKVKLDVPELNLVDCGLDVTFSQGIKSHVSAAYRWHAHAGSLSVSLEVNPNMVILRGDADVPVLLGALPHDIRGSVEYSETGAYISLRYENGKSANEISLLVRNDETLLTLAAHADTGLTGVKDITFTIGKKLDQLEIDMWKSCYLKLNVNSENGLISCKCLNREHVLSYHARREHGFKGGFIAESPLLKSGKINITIDVTNVQDNMKVYVDLMFADNHFKGTTSLSRLGKLTEIKVGLTSSSIQVFGLNASGMMTDTNFSFEASLEIMATVNRVTLRHQHYLPLDSELTILSPYLPHKLIRGALKSQNDSVMAYAGQGAATFVPFLTIVVSRSPEAGTAELSFNAPSLSLCKHFSLHVAHRVAKDIYVSLGAKFSSESVPTANASVEFILNQNVLEASVHISTSLEGFEIVGAHVLVPLQISLDFSPRVSVSLPYGHEYSLKAALRLLENSLEATFVGNFRAKKFGLEFAFLYGSIGKIQFEFNLPFGSVKHFRVDLTGHKSLTDGKDVVNFIEWNEERVELKYAGALDANKVVFHLELLTPFSQHKRYDLRLHYENMQRKVATATLTLPGLPEDIGVQFDIFFHNILNIDFLGQITLPFWGDFNTISLLFGNKMDGGVLKCVLASRYNENELTVALDGRLVDMGVNVVLRAKLNQDETSLRIWGTPAGNGFFETSLELKTPLSKLRHVQIYLFSSFNPSDGIVANVSFNSRAIVSIVLSKDRTTGHSLALDNPWRPMSATFYYNLQDEFSIISEFCWDLKNKSHSTVGVKVILKPHADNRLEISTGIKIPTRTVLMDATYQDTPGRFEYIKKFSWEEGQNVGCHLIVDTREVGGKKRAIVLLRGDLPYRSFEVNVNKEMDQEDKEPRLVTELLWDALGDRSKKMALVMERIPNRTEVVFQHSGLPHQLTLRTIKRSATTAIEFEYSPAKENKLTIEYNLDIAPDPQRKLEALFAIHHNASLLNLQVALQAGVTPEKVNGDLGIEYRHSNTGRMRLIQMSGSLSRSQPRLEVSVRNSKNFFSVGVGDLSGEDGYRRFNLRTKVNQKEPLSADLKFKSNHPIFEFEVRSGDTSSYSVYAGMPNRREILFGARHTLDGVQTVDGLLMVKLNTTQLLWTKVQWRPEMFKDFFVYFMQPIGDVFLMLDTVSEDISDFVEHDFLKKMEVFYPAATEVFTELAAYVRRETDDVLQDLRGTASEIRAMYLRGDFFFKQIYDSTKQAINYLCERLPFINDFLDLLGTVWTGTARGLGVLLDSLYLELSSLWATLSDVQEALVSTVRSRVAAVRKLFSFQNVRNILSGSLWCLKLFIIWPMEVARNVLEKIRVITSNILDKYTAFMEPYVATAQDILLYGSTVLMQARDKMTGRYHDSVLLRGDIRGDIGVLDDRGDIRVLDDGVLLQRGDIKMLDDRGDIRMLDDRGDIRVLDDRGGIRVLDDSGDIRVLDDRGDIRVLDDRGDIRVLDDRGDIRVLDDRGDIRVLDDRGDIRVLDDSGDIRVLDDRGDIRVLDDRGDIRVLDDRGDIRVLDDRGDIRVLDDRGDIRVLDDRGDIKVLDDSGGIRVLDDRGDIRVLDDSGDIRVLDDSGGIRVLDDRGDIRVLDDRGDIRVLDDRGDIRVLDDSGGIRVLDDRGDIRVLDDRGGIRVLDDREVISEVMALAVNETQLQRLLDLYLDYSSWLEEFHLQEWRAILLQDLLDIFSDYKSEVTTLYQAVADKVSAVADIKEVAYFRGVISYFYQKEYIAEGTTSDHVMTSVPPAGHVMTGVLPAGHVMTSVPPAGHVITSVPPAGHVVTSVPPAGHVITSVPPAGHVITSIPPAGYVITSVPPAGHVITSIPPAGHVIASVPPAGHVMTSVPPAGHVMTSVPPAGSSCRPCHVITSVPPAGHVMTGVPPADHVITSVPPAGHVMTCVPPADHVITGVPPAGHVMTGVPPADHVMTGVPPADHVMTSCTSCRPCHVMTSVPPAGHVMTIVPPAGHVITSIPPAGHVMTSVPPAGHVMTSVPHAGHVMTIVPPAGHVIASVPPADHVITSIPPAGHVMTSVPPAGHVMTSVPPAGHVMTSVPPAGHAKWVWHYYEMSDQVKLSLHRFVSNIDSVLLNLIGALDVGTLSTLPGAPTLLLRPDAGLLEYAQPLPVEWRGFDEVPRFGEGPLSRQGPEPEVEQRSGRYQDYANPGFLYPSFSHHAVLAGDGHYITFSGVHYTLKGNCSYLLAGDLLDNRFSLLVNYQHKSERRFSKQSLTLITDTGHHINIDTNTRQVTVNGKRKELPLLVGGSTRVVRSGEKILFSTEYGVSISCDLHYDLCVVELSGWYRGKTGGLLGGVSGTLTLPDGTPTRDVTGLARAWRVGHPGSCSESDAPPTDQYPETQEVKELCRGLYEDLDSPLVTCHDEVDYAPYYAMCLEDMSRAEGALCASAAVYITECNKRGMEVPMPRGCGRCPLPDGSTISPGEVQVFDGNSPQSADIVLIVEQASCLQELQLSQLTDKLDSALNLAGLIDNRYSVVGFGGDRFPEPQTYTVDGEIWLGRRALSKAFRGLVVSYNTPEWNQIIAACSSNENDHQPTFEDFVRMDDDVLVLEELTDDDIIPEFLEIEQEEEEEGCETCEDEPLERVSKRDAEKALETLHKYFEILDFALDTSNTSAALEALWVATHLSWRAGVSKTVVLVQCGHCEEGAEGYSELLSVLLEADITLHLLEPRAALLRVDKSSKGKLYGADQRGAFTGRNLRNLQPSAALLRQVALPKDLCTPLALETNGTLFNLERVLPVKGSTYQYSTVKKFVDVWTRRLAWSAQPSSCQKCDCVLDSDGVPMVSCTRCVTPSIEQFLQEWESLDDDNNVRSSVDLEENFY